MTWLPKDTTPENHECKMPPMIFSTSVELDKDPVWECDVCRRRHEPGYWYSKETIKHKVGDKFWYFVNLGQGE